jgi:hypothetical protein
MNPRLGDVALGQILVEADDDDRGPSTMKGIPPSSVSERRPEVIAQRHGGTLRRSKSACIL